MRGHVKRKPLFSFWECAWPPEFRTSTQTSATFPALQLLPGPLESIKADQCLWGHSAGTFLRNIPYILSWTLWQRGALTSPAILTWNLFILRNKYSGIYKLIYLFILRNSSSYSKQEFCISEEQPGVFQKGKKKKRVMTAASWTVLSYLRRARCDGRWPGTNTDKLLCYKASDWQGVGLD